MEVKRKNILRKKQALSAIRACFNDKIISLWILIFVFNANLFCQDSFYRPFDGLCYSPFRNGQSPDLGIFPTRNEIIQDIVLLSNITKNIRTYGDDKTLYEIPGICDSLGINCYPGAWISTYSYTEQINNLKSIALKNYSITKGFIVGNEVIYRNDRPEDTLIRLILEMKAITTKPVTTAETWNVWLNHPKLAANVDYIAVHIHPYWEGLLVDSAAKYVIKRYKEVQNAYPGKKVVIYETGWPTAGQTKGDAVPGLLNQKKFLCEFRDLAEKNNAHYFVFEAFDEAWKGTGAEGYWGIFDTGRVEKFDFNDTTTNMKSTLASSEFMIYQNPAGEKLVVELMQPGRAVYLTVRDLNGKETFMQKINSKTMIVDISKLKKGIYFIEIEGNNDRTVKKIIKK